jgi:uncharacterized membrane protein
MRRWIVDSLRRDFLAGLLVFVPVGFTVLGVLWLIDVLDSLVLPWFFKPFGLDASPPRFVGTIVTIGLILLAGALTRSFVGRGALKLWERLVQRIPIARSLYAVLKQFMQALIGVSSTTNFDRVVVLEYPRKGIYTYGFVTGRNRLQSPDLPDDLIKVFVSSTPNPTTGYFLLVPDEQLIDTGLSVEEAFKLIVSAGVADGAPPLLSQPLDVTAESSLPG